MILPLWGRALSSWRMELGPRFWRYGSPLAPESHSDISLNTNRRVLQGILAHFFGPLPTRLAVLLSPTNARSLQVVPRCKGD